jgi:hypothetical protein
MSAMIRSVALLAVTTLVASSPADAQRRPTRSLSLVSGIAYFDIRGEGYTPTLAAHVDHGWAGDWVVFEAGVGYTPLLTTFAVDRTHLLALEGQVQLQVPRWRIRPYVGIGAGAMLYMTNPDSDGRVAELASVSTGVRVPLTPKWGLRADARLQLWERARGTNDAYVHGAAGLSLGMARLF